MEIAVVGTGYVGLVTGACLAEFGHRVTCVDIDQEKINNLNQGIIPIYERNLPELVHKNVAQQQLCFTSDLANAIKKSKIIFLAVGTPTRAENDGVDLSYVHTAAIQIAENIDGYKLVILKSTIPVGTTDHVAEIIRHYNPAADCDVVFNPEFLREGNAVHDFLHPDRIILGTQKVETPNIMREVYAPLFLNETPFIVTDTKSAELIKYASNAFLAAKVAFINEMADLCEVTGANIQDVALGMGLDNRISPQFLNPGPGYGGSCFPKDTRALAKTGRDFNSPSCIVESVIAQNEARKCNMVNKIIAACSADIGQKTIALLGITFKAGTDDIRESAGLDIINGLQAKGAKVRVYDPQGMEKAKLLFKDVEWCESINNALLEVDGAVIVTEWEAFKHLDLANLDSIMAIPTLIDLRNLYPLKVVRQYPINYHSIGRPSILQALDSRRIIKKYGT